MRKRQELAEIPKMGPRGYSDWIAVDGQKQRSRVPREFHPEIPGDLPHGTEAMRLPLQCASLGKVCAPNDTSRQSPPPSPPKRVETACQRLRIGWRRWRETDEKNGLETAPDITAAMWWTPIFRMRPHDQGDLQKEPQPLPAHRRNPRSQQRRRPAQPRGLPWQEKTRLN